VCGDRLAVAGLLSLVTASIAYTLSESVLFAGLRKRVESWNAWLGKLLNCGYCAGHWIAFALVAIYRPRLFHAWAPLDYFLTAIAVAWLAAFQWATLCWIVGRAGK